MDPRSEVIIRQIDFLKGSILLAGCSADDLINQLKHHPSITQVNAWLWLNDDYQLLHAQHPKQCTFAITPPDQKYDQVVVFLPKSKELTQYLLYQATQHIHPNGQILLVGEKKTGIERASKQLSQLGKTLKLDSARHCQLWLCHDIEQPKEKPLQQWLNQYQVNVENIDQTIEVVTLPGVFSHGRLDQGSALLVEHLSNLPKGDLLDFGCGAGVIGTLLKKIYPKQTVYFLDIDAFALESTRLTLQANDITLDDSVQLIAGRGVVDAPINLAAIISNPPFHQGVRTHYKASEDLLTHSIKHLKPGGELRIVANNFLRYSHLIEQQFKFCNTIAQRHGFNVYQAKRNA